MSNLNIHEYATIGIPTFNNNGTAIGSAGKLNTNKPAPKTGESKFATNTLADMGIPDFKKNRGQSNYAVSELATMGLPNMNKESNFAVSQLSVMGTPNMRLENNYEEGSYEEGAYDEAAYEEGSFKDESPLFEGIRAKLFPCRQECLDKVGNRGAGFKECLRTCKGKGATKSAQNQQALDQQAELQKQLSTVTAPDPNASGSSNTTMYLIIGFVLLLVCVGAFMFLRKGKGGVAPKVATA